MFLPICCVPPGPVENEIELTTSVITKSPEASVSSTSSSIMCAGPVPSPDSLSRLMLFGAMNSAVEWFDPERGSLDSFTESITRQFWSGLSAREQDA